MLNQDIHKNLRRNNNAIPLVDTAPLAAFNYKRPPGFSLVPSLMGITAAKSSSSSTSSNQNLAVSPAPSTIASNSKSGRQLASQPSAAASYFDNVQEEMQR